MSDALRVLVLVPAAADDLCVMSDDLRGASDALRGDDEYNDDDNGDDGDGDNIGDISSSAKVGSCFGAFLFAVDGVDKATPEVADTSASEKEVRLEDRFPPLLLLLLLLLL